MGNILISALMPLLWMAIGFSGLITLIKILKPKIKGKVGEFAVQMHVKLYLNENYVLLNDCTLPDDLSGTTQIDHILLSPYGIFVIETKNYKGWIFGGEHQKMWTQKIFKNSYKFQNPIHQNYKHIKVLEQVLEDVVDLNFIHSAIVFMPDCEFKTQMPSNVFKGAAWVDYVKNYSEIVIPPMKLKRIQLRIEKEVLEKSWKTNRLHVNNLRNNRKSL